MKISGPSTFPAHSIALSGQEPFARGTKRHCYVHPDDPDLCVKVAARADADCLRQQRWDLEDCKRLRARGAGSVFDRIPAIVGVVDTDLGRGIVMRLYRDRDGRISRNLSQAIREHGLTPSLIRAIDGMKRWLRKERLLTMDTAPYNVVAVRLGGGWKLMIIEGWENRKYRWLASLHPFVKDRLIARQLRKFDRRVSRVAEASQVNSGAAFSDVPRRPSSPEDIPEES